MLAAPETGSGRATSRTLDSRLLLQYFFYSIVFTRTQIKLFLLYVLSAKQKQKPHKCAGQLPQARGRLAL